MTEAYKIGTVETLRVCKTGRRFYVNLSAYTIQAFGIQAGDILKVEIKEGFKPPQEED